MASGGRNNTTSPLPAASRDVPSAIHEHDVSAVYPRRHGFGRDGGEGHEVRAEERAAADPERRGERGDGGGPRELVAHGPEFGGAHRHLDGPPGRPRGITKLRAHLEGAGFDPGSDGFGVADGSRGDARDSLLLGGGGDDAAASPEEARDLVALARVESEGFERAPGDGDAADDHLRGVLENISSARRGALGVSPRRVDDARRDARQRSRGAGSSRVGGVIAHERAVRAGEHAGRDDDARAAETPGAARRRGTTSPATSEVEAYSRADHPKRLRARGRRRF